MIKGTMCWCSNCKEIKNSFYAEARQTITWNKDQYPPEGADWHDDLVHENDEVGTIYCTDCGGLVDLISESTIENFTIEELMFELFQRIDEESPESLELSMQNLAMKFEQLCRWFGNLQVISWDAELDRADISEPEFHAFIIALRSAAETISAKLTRII